MTDAGRQQAADQQPGISGTGEMIAAAAGIIRQPRSNIVDRAMRAGLVDERRQLPQVVTAHTVGQQMDFEAFARIGAQHRRKHDPGIGAVTRVGGAQQVNRIAGIAHSSGL